MNTFHDGIGRLPSSVDVPVMKGRKILNLKREIAELDQAISDLADTPCCFWACRGPRAPKHMVTCRRCWALRQISAVRETLFRALKRDDNCNLISQ